MKKIGYGGLLLMGLFGNWACGISKLLPKKPVLTAKERQALPTQRNVVYTGKPLVEMPVLPVQVWAATYALDVILVSQHPDWNMHELAKLRTPEGDLWLMKDADNATLSQFIVANVANIEQWLPEIPVLRKSYPVRVEERQEGKFFSLRVEYENRHNELVKAEYYGKIPVTKQPQRNGSTMGHSRDQLIAVLDLPLRDFGKRASISYNGKPYKMKRLLGLVPFQMALTQTQGGISRGNYEQKPDKQGFSVHYAFPETTVANTWTLRDSGDYTIAEQQNNLRTIRYFFQRGAEGRLELAHASVQQWDSAVESFRISFFPALPDLRCRFDGTLESTFVMDVGGQPNHATGNVQAYWLNDGQACALNILPTAPWWVTDRPTQTTIRYEAGNVQIQNRPISTN